MLFKKFRSLGKLAVVLTVGISLLGCGASQEDAKTEKTPQELEESRQEHIETIRSEMEGS